MAFRCEPKRECKLSRGVENTSFFSGFPAPNPVPFLSSAATDIRSSSSSPSCATSLPEVPTRVPVVDGKLEPWAGPSGEGADENVSGIISSGQDSVLAQMWQSLCFSEPLITEALLGWVATSVIPSATIVLVSNPATPVYETLLPHVSPCLYECIVSPPGPFLRCTTRIDDYLKLI